MPRSCKLPTMVRTAGSHQLPFRFRDVAFHQWTPRFTACLSGGVGYNDRRSAARAFVIDRGGIVIEAYRQSRFREVDNPVLPVRRRFAPGFLGSETEGSCRVPRPLLADRNVGSGSDAQRASAAAGETGASPGTAELGRWHGEHERPSRRVLSQPDGTCSRSELPHAGQQPHAISRRLAVHGHGRRGQTRAARVPAECHFTAAQTECGSVHATGTVRRAAWRRAQPAVSAGQPGETASVHRSQSPASLACILKA